MLLRATKTISVSMFVEGLIPGSQCPGDQRQRPEQGNGLVDNGSRGMAGKKKKYKKSSSGTRREPAIPAKPSTPHPISSFLRKYQYYLGTAIGFSALAVNFVIHYINTPTRTSEFITNNITFNYPLEILAFSLIALCFAYFIYRELKGLQTIGRSALLVLGFGFFGLACLYYLAFNEELLPNGDNAEYLMSAKSLVEEGGFYRLHMPGDTPNSLASIGLPVMLAPLYALWGFDLVKMKIMVVILTLLIFPLLVRLFQPLVGWNQSLIISLPVLVSPHILASSSNLMTEAPYMFWSVLALVVVQLFQKQKSGGWGWLLLIFLTGLMTYFTRAVGITFLVALGIYLFFQVPWLTYVRTREWKKLLSQRTFHQFIMVTIPLGLAAVVWQLWQQGMGVSQAKIFFSGDLHMRFIQNFDSSLRIVGQMLFSVETFYWYIFFGDYTLTPLGIWWIPILVFMLCGVVWYIWKCNIIGFYTAICWLVVLLASLTPAEMVIMRYLTILIPFLAFLTFEGFKGTFLGLGKLLQFKVNQQWVKVGAILLMVHFLFVSFSADLAVITQNYVGQGPAYEDYIEVAKWSANNLPDDAIVVAIKPRIFWLYAQKDAMRSTNIDETYSEAYARRKLRQWKNRGVTHLVLDRISAATRENIFPIVESNPDLFQTLYVGSVSGSSSILKIEYE